MIRFTLSSRTRHLSAATVLATLLAACGGGEDPAVQTISAQPVALVMRPGESDLARLVGNEPGVTPFDVSVDAEHRPWIDASPLAGCVPGASQCRHLPVAVTSDTGMRKAVEITFNFTLDPNSRLFGNLSYMPVNAFPAMPDRAPPAVRFAAGGNSVTALSVALTADGRVWTWGTNEWGAMAVDDRSNRAMPTMVDHGLTDIVAVDVGLGDDDRSGHVLAIAADRTVYTWGSNGNRQIDTADGAPLHIPLPRVVPLPFADVIAVAAGGRLSLALRADGTVWAWGSTFGSVLGPGGVGGSPGQVPGVDGVRAISAGEDHALALRSDGTVWAWGENEFGQTGSASRRDTRPQQVLGIDNVQAIDAGPGYSLALRNDGTVWAWGRNDHNQLGADAALMCGEVACDHTPRRVGTGFGDVLTIAAGGRFALARQRDGSVWAWGANDQGQIIGLPGLGTREPTRVTSLPAALNIAAGARHALAMPLDESCAVGDGRFGGRLMAWGDNFNGERGDGTSINAFRPTPVLTLGDDDRCAGTLGQRLIVYQAGTATGVVGSDVPGLSCSGMICWQSVPTGTPVTLTATPDAGFVVGDWRWDCAAEAGATRTVSVVTTTHCKVRFMRTASATPEPVTDRALAIVKVGSGTVTSAPAGIDCGAICRGVFPEGTTVTLSASADAGWVFRGFSGAEDCADGSVTLAADTSCTATFEASAPADRFTLNVVRTGVATGGPLVVSVMPDASMNCGAVCSATYPSGTAVWLRASTASPDLHFSHWTGCDAVELIDAEPICIVFLGAHRTVEADFQ